MTMLKRSLYVEGIALFCVAVLTTTVAGRAEASAQGAASLALALPQLLSSATLQIRGVSLSGAEFSPGTLPGTLGTNYIYPTAASFNYFKAKGMDTARLPFLWERLQPTLFQSFDLAELARVTNFVNQVTATGATVVLDPHNYARYRGNLVGSSTVPYTAFADFWARLATQFKNNDKVVFGLMNEPNTMPTEQWLAGANAALVVIRSTGALNVVTVPGHAWSGAFSWDATWYGTPNANVMGNVVDPGNNMVFEVHMYLDSDSSGTSPVCVSTTIGSERLQFITAWMRNRGFRAYLGEMGTPSNTTCNLAMANMLDYMQANSDVWVGWTWWVAGPWWGSNPLSIEPDGTTDKPQMAVLQPYLNVVPPIDTDGDTVADSIDNCTLVTNANQRDANGDGYGNGCDADLNNSGLVTSADFAILRSVLGLGAASSPTAAAADFNDSGTVTTADMAILRARLNSAPGPSGLHP